MQEKDFIETPGTVHLNYTYTKGIPSTSREALDEGMYSMNPFQKLLGWPLELSNVDMLDFLHYLKTFNSAKIF